MAICAWIFCSTSPRLWITCLMIGVSISSMLPQKVRVAFISAFLFLMAIANMAGLRCCHGIFQMSTSTSPGAEATIWLFSRYPHSWSCCIRSPTGPNAFSSRLLATSSLLTASSKDGCPTVSLLLPNPVALFRAMLCHMVDFLYFVWVSINLICLCLSRLIGVPSCPSIPYWL